MTDHIPVESPDNRQTASDHGHITNQTVNLGGPTLVVVAVLTAIIGACGVVMGLNLAKQSQMDRDFRDLGTKYALEERRKMDLEAYLEVNGFKVPGDDENGPTGNLRRMKKGK